MNSNNRVDIDVFCNDPGLEYANWPQFLDVRPVLGEYISSLDHKHSRIIVRIEHKLVRVNYPEGHLWNKYVMGIEVSQNRRPR